MRVYVAGKWEEKERVREIMAQLMAAGHTITHDWTTEVPGDEAHMRANALRDCNGVGLADVFVGIFEKDLAYKGAYVEMGIAIARDIPIYILGHAQDSNIFMYLPQVKRGLEELLHVKSVSSER